jgi:plastocyanin
MNLHRQFNPVTLLLPLVVLAAIVVTAACGANPNYKSVATVPPAAPSAATVSAAVSASAQSSAAAVTVQALIANLTFPDTIAVKPGTTITWTNKDSFAHTVTANPGQSETFDSKNLNAAGTFSVTFTKAGTFSYHCNIHPTMTGKVVVGDSAGGVSTPAANTAPPDYKY